MRDHIDDHVAAWRHELPWMDPVKEQIFARLLHISRHLAGARAESLREGRLALWQFKTLLMLRRQGSPYELNPSALADALGLTRGGLSGRLGLLEREGLIERTHGEADRRRVTVRLTARGLDAVESQARDEEATELRALGALSPREREQLAHLLRKVVLEIGSAD